VKELISSAAHSKEGEESNEALVGRLRRFIDDSDLSFYRIASLIGTSGTFLSMWLARTAKPHATELAQIERLLTTGQRQAHQDGSPRTGDSSA
jgi:DNA transposition AAA+ family ATPase